MLPANPQLLSASQRRKLRRTIALTKAFNAQKQLRELQAKEAKELADLEKKRAARRTRQAAAKTAKANADAKELLEKLGAEAYNQHLWKEWEDSGDAGSGDRASDQAWDNWDAENDDSDETLNPNWDEKTQSFIESDHSDHSDNSDDSDNSDNSDDSNEDLSDLDSPEHVGANLMNHDAFKTPRNRKNRKKNHIAKVRRSASHKERRAQHSKIPFSETYGEEAVQSAQKKPRLADDGKSISSKSYKTTPGYKYARPTNPSFDGNHIRAMGFIDDIVSYCDLREIPNQFSFYLHTRGPFLPLTGEALTADRELYSLMSSFLTGAYKQTMALKYNNTRSAHLVFKDLVDHFFKRCHTTRQVLQMSLNAVEFKPGKQSIPQYFALCRKLGADFCAVGGTLDAKSLLLHASTGLMVNEGLRQHVSNIMDAIPDIVLDTLESKLNEKANLAKAIRGKRTGQTSAPVRHRTSNHSEARDETSNYGMSEAPSSRKPFERREKFQKPWEDKSILRDPYNKEGVGGQQRVPRKNWKEQTKSWNSKADAERAKTQAKENYEAHLADIENFETHLAEESSSSTTDKSALDLLSEVASSENDPFGETMSNYFNDVNASDPFCAMMQVIGNIDQTTQDGSTTSTESVPSSQMARGGQNLVAETMRSTELTSSVALAFLPGCVSTDTTDETVDHHDDIKMSGDVLALLTNVQEKSTDDPAMDSGTSHCIFNNRNRFGDDYKECNIPITHAGGQSIYACGKGTVTLPLELPSGRVINHPFRNSLHVPMAVRELISTTELENDGCTIIFKKGHSSLILPNDVRVPLVMKGRIRLLPLHKPAAPLIRKVLNWHETAASSYSKAYSQPVTEHVSKASKHSHSSPSGKAIYRHVRQVAQRNDGQTQRWTWGVTDPSNPSPTYGKRKHR